MYMVQVRGMEIILLCRLYQSKSNLAIVMVNLMAINGMSCLLALFFLPFFPSSLKEDMG